MAKAEAERKALTLPGPLSDEKGKLISIFETKTWSFVTYRF